MKKKIRKIFLILLNFVWILIPSWFYVSCSINNKEVLDLIVKENDIKTFSNENYTSQRLFAKYKNNYHDCDFEIINTLPWMSIKDNCFCIANVNKENGTYYPSIIAKSKTICGLVSQPKQIMVHIQNQTSFVVKNNDKNEINHVDWNNIQDQYLAIAGDEFSICQIDLSFDTNLSIETIIEKIKFTVDVIDGPPIDTNGNNLFYVKVINNEFYLYISPHSFSTNINYVTTYKLKIKILSNDKQNSKVYLDKTINVKAIDGLTYEEDDLKYKRLSAKESWTLTNIGNSIQKIVWDKPKIIYNHIVDKIGKNAAREDENLNHVEISYELEEIGESAFYKCSNLKSAYLTTKKVKEFAFFLCEKLSDAKIVVNKSIDRFAFKYCPRLTNCITLGKNFEYFYWNSFMEPEDGEPKTRYYEKTYERYIFILNLNCQIPPIAYGEFPLRVDGYSWFWISLSDDVNETLFADNIKNLLNDPTRTKYDATMWNNLNDGDNIWGKSRRSHQWMEIDSTTEPLTDDPYRPSLTPTRHPWDKDKPKNNN